MPRERGARAAYRHLHYQPLQFLRPCRVACTSSLRMENLPVAYCWNIWRMIGARCGSSSMVLLVLSCK